MDPYRGPISKGVHVRPARLQLWKCTIMTLLILILTLAIPLVGAVLLLRVLRPIAAAVGGAAGFGFGFFFWFRFCWAEAPRSHATDWLPAAVGFSALTGLLLGTILFLVGLGIHWLTSQLTGVSGPASRLRVRRGPKEANGGSSNAAR